MPIQSVLDRHVHNRSMITQIALYLPGSDLKHLESMPLPEVFAYYSTLGGLLKDRAPRSNRVF